MCPLFDISYIFCRRRSVERAETDGTHRSLFVDKIGDGAGGNIVLFKDLSFLVRQDNIYRKRSIFQIFFHLFAVLFPLCHQHGANGGVLFGGRKIFNQGLGIARGTIKKDQRRTTHTKTLGRVKDSPF